MRLVSRLKHPFALVAQGFALGGLLFFATHSDRLGIGPGAALPADEAPDDEEDERDEDRAEPVARVRDRIVHYHHHRSQSRPQQPGGVGPGPARLRRCRRFRPRRHRRSSARARTCRPRRLLTTRRRGRYVLHQLDVAVVAEALHVTPEDLERIRAALSLRGEHLTRRRPSVFVEHDAVAFRQCDVAVFDGIVRPEGHIQFVRNQPRCRLVFGHRREQPGLAQPARAAALLTFDRIPWSWRRPSVSAAGPGCRM